MLANSRLKSTPSTKSSSPDLAPSRITTGSIVGQPFSFSSFRFRNASRNCPIDWTKEMEVRSRYLAAEREVTCLRVGRSRRRIGCGQITVGASSPDGRQAQTVPSRCPQVWNNSRGLEGNSFPAIGPTGPVSPKELRCQGELNVFHLLPIGAIGRFTDRTSDKR
jgi:hypothetical protein